MQENTTMPDNGKFDNSAILTSSAKTLIQLKDFEPIDAKAAEEAARQQAAAEEAARAEVLRVAELEREAGRQFVRNGAELVQDTGAAFSMAALMTVVPYVITVVPTKKGWISPQTAELAGVVLKVSALSYFTDSYMPAAVVVGLYALNQLGGRVSYFYNNIQGTVDTMSTTFASAMTQQSLSVGSAWEMAKSGASLLGGYLGSRFGGWVNTSIFDPVAEKIAPVRVMEKPVTPLPSPRRSPQPLQPAKINSNGSGFFATQPLHSDQGQVQSVQYRSAQGAQLLKPQAPLDMMLPAQVPAVQQQQQGSSQQAAPHYQPPAWGGYNGF